MYLREKGQSISSQMLRQMLRQRKVPAVTEEELTAAVESDDPEEEWDGRITKMTLDGRPMADALVEIQVPPEEDCWMT